MSVAVQIEHEEEERLGNNRDGSQSLAPRSCTPLIICVILISVNFVGTLSYCILHHRLPVKDLCYAHATLGGNKDDWKWNTTLCASQIKVNNTSVTISSAGVYYLDIQLFATHISGIADITLTVLTKKIFTKIEYIGGAFQSPIKNSSYARMSQTLVLNEGDELRLTLNGIEKYYSNDNRTTYWKLLKVKSL